jgi:hypothetical protein
MHFLGPAVPARARERSLSFAPTQQTWSRLPYKGIHERQKVDWQRAEKTSRVPRGRVTSASLSVVVCEILTIFSPCSG